MNSEKVTETPPKQPQLVGRGLDLGSREIRKNEALRQNKHTQNPDATKLALTFTALLHTHDQTTSTVL